MAVSALAIPQRFRMDELWRRLEALFHDCAGTPPALRSDYLDVRCAREPRVRSEVEALLAASPDAEGFVEEIVRRVVDEPGDDNRAAPSALLSRTAPDPG
jgi:hypothetical protein